MNRFFIVRPFRLGRTLNQNATQSGEDVIVATMTGARALDIYLCAECRAQFSYEHAKTTGETSDTCRPLEAGCGCGTEFVSRCELMCNSGTSAAGRNSFAVVLHERVSPQPQILLR